MKPSRLIVAALVLLPLLAARTAGAHCDSLDGPVVKDARAALDSGDVRIVLKWVPPAAEAEVRAAFDQTLAVRKPGGAARDLADRFFFETLVRVHRQGEGEPFTGLKPLGAPLDPAVAAADAALESGSVDALARDLAAAAEAGLRHRYARAVEARRLAPESVALGREYVAAYVEFVHYAERLHTDVSTSAHTEGAAPAREH